MEVEMNQQVEIKRKRGRPQTRHLKPVEPVVMKPPRPKQTPEEKREVYLRAIRNYHNQERRALAIYRMLYSDRRAFFLEALKEITGKEALPLEVALALETFLGELNRNMQ